MPEIAYYKDAFVDMDEKVVPIQERAHQFGDGIYEVIRVYNGKPFFMKEHLTRLQKSADAIELQLPYSMKEIESLCDEGLKRSGLADAEIYMQISRGIHPRQHFYPDPACSVFTMTVKQAKVIPEDLRKQGVKVMTTEDVRWKNCYIKSLNLLPNVMAKQKAKVNDCEEAIFHEDGIVKEGCSTNVFVIKDEKLYTYPALKGILHGITRQIILDLAADLEIEAVEEPFDVNFLYDADEAFISSTNMEIMPIRQVDDAKLPSNRPLTVKLIEQFQKLY
ncbi:amino acid aminotransferase [Salipaludibacillus keqinensis]|uniref:Amino acid aminotransferase n=1 Tax=Salipaludibacillus keqinensis TaxID=2045207 RepID=A0A323TFA7_9BACI|nr:aminotransferase class IV [Salipaludibacillus keqinensis]PYZ93651.1 amino acid aminotransferase [Salipaludibacillus keqinensis]